MASSKNERAAPTKALMPAPKKAFAGRSLRDRLEADLAFELEGRRIVDEADRILKDSESLRTFAEDTLRRLESLGGKFRKSA
jgi:hypothetical protein